jgi:hypothetical protein
MPSHLLAAAYRQLCASAERAQLNAASFLEAVTAFLGALSTVRGAQDELRRRAAKTAGPEDVVGMAYRYLSDWSGYRDDYETNWHGGEFLADALLTQVADKIPRAAAALMDGASGQAADVMSPEEPGAEAWLSAPELAVRYGVDSEKLRKRLEYWWKRHGEDYRETEFHKPREARFLYRLSAALPVVQALQTGRKASGETSGERPSK